MKATFASCFLKYIQNELPEVPKNTEGVSAMDPFGDPEAIRVCKEFYSKFYNDREPRLAFIGINPGRYGGGITGIPFTDPVALMTECGITSKFPLKRELSSRFVYDMIKQAGGAERFYGKCVFATMYPLALIKENRNFNYYDSESLYLQLRDDIIFNLKKQISCGIRTDLAICLGKKNLHYLNEINNEHRLFSRIEMVEHPRFIQQYKLKTAGVYIEKYLKLAGLKD